VQRRIRSTLAAAVATAVFLGTMAVIAAAQAAIPRPLSVVPISADEARACGRSTSHGVALSIEYPGFRQ
jgi:hypothetical protein